MQHLHLQTQPVQNVQDQQPLLMVRHLKEHLVMAYQIIQPKLSAVAVSLCCAFTHSIPSSLP